MDDKSFFIRVPKRWVRVATIVGVTALIVAPLTAIASHSFNDVPDSNTFHEDIAWLAESGVTRGCNPPDNTEFCPDDNVTREQMSAFMRRFAQYLGAEDGTPAQADHANTADSANTADNADTLDGSDSSAFAQASDNGAFNARNTGFIDVGTADTEILTLDLPAGDYIVIATGMANNNASDVISFNCDLTAGGDSYPLSTERLGPATEDDRDQVMLMTPASLDSATTVNWTCSADIADGNIVQPSITALAVSGGVELSSVAAHTQGDGD